MSEQNISDMIANNTSLTASLAKVIAEKAAMEKRMGQQISRLRNETGNKRKSTEMDDADSPHVGILRQMVDDKEKELTYVRDQNANGKRVSSNVVLPDFVTYSRRFEHCTEK